MTANVLPLPAQAYVYVIGAEDGPQKIGIASDPENRLTIFQTGNPAALKVSAALPISRDKAFAVESYAHRLLAHKRVRGEWFNVSPADAAKAVRMAFAAVLDQKPAEDSDQTAAPAITKNQMRMARAGLGWGVRDLAERTGLQPGTISRIENGKEAMGGSLRKIEQAFSDAGIDFPDDFTVSIKRMVEKSAE